MSKNKKCAVRSIANGLAFEGVIDHQSIPGLLKRMPEVSVDEPELDLSAVRRIDSAGLAFLIYWGERLVPPSQKILLTGVSVQACQLIDTMRLDSVFDVQAANIQATDVQATDVQATDVQATDVQTAAPLSQDTESSIERTP